MLAGSVVLSAGVADGLGVELADDRAAGPQLESELAGLRERRLAGTSAKADFLANVSHELRTPVTVAKGIAYVLRNPTVPEAEREQFLEQLRTSLDKLMGSSTS